MRTVGNILWLIFAGVWLAASYFLAGLILFGWAIFLAHLVTGLILCITIIGIPFGIQAFKLSVLALFPFGRTVVRTDSAAAAETVIAVPANPSGR